MQYILKVMIVYNTVAMLSLRTVARLKFLKKYYTRQSGLGVTPSF